LQTTLQAAGSSTENVKTVTDVTKKERTYETVDSGGATGNIGKEKNQENDAKATIRTGDKTVTPDKETKAEELKTPVRVCFST